MSMPDLPQRPTPAPVTEDGWIELKRATAARIALGRAGASLPTRAVLEFELAHARARDAVHAALDIEVLCAELGRDGWDLIQVQSRAADRAAYLARPDWGRRLQPDSAARLAARRADCDLAIVLADGLSATALQNHAAPLLRSLRPLLGGQRLAPLVLAIQARVALADEIGELLGARLALILIGERPGLSAADSLGAYLTYAPRLGRNDAERNCISNIRPSGLNYAEAARQIATLIQSASTQRLTGTALRPAIHSSE